MATVVLVVPLGPNGGVAGVTLKASTADKPMLALASKSRKTFALSMPSSPSIPISRRGMMWAATLALEMIEGEMESLRAVEDWEGS